MSQLTLFAPEASSAQSAPAGCLTKFACMEALIACPVIESDLMQVVGARSAEWLNWPAFRSVIDKHAVGLDLGHKLGSMQRHGLIEEKQIFLGRGIGADCPGSPDYQGFQIKYRLAPTSSERTA